MWHAQRKPNPMNNTKILTKCIDALKGDKPDLSYVRGMLETLVEMQPGEITYSSKQVITPNSPILPTFIPQTIDEASMLDGMAKAAIAKGIPTATE